MHTVLKYLGTVAAVYLTVSIIPGISVAGGWVTILLVVPGFVVAGFVPALLGAIVLSILSWLIHKIL